MKSRDDDMNWSFLILCKFILCLQIVGHKLLQPFVWCVCALYYPSTTAIQPVHRHFLYRGKTRRMIGSLAGWLAGLVVDLIKPRGPSKWFGFCMLFLLLELVVSLVCTPSTRRRTASLVALPRDFRGCTQDQ